MKTATESRPKDWITRVNRRIADLSAALNVLLVILVIGDVFSRYVFANTAVWIMELEWHFFAAIVLLAAPYTLATDEHVRVDLFYNRFARRDRALVNLVGHVVFLIPWCLAVIWFSSLFALEAWSTLESSPDPDGLPFRFIIKGLIPIGFLLLLLQGLADLRRNWVIYRKEKKG